jgi:hypothetical protein
MLRSGEEVPNEDAGTWNQQYGWECFTLTERASKLAYMGQQIRAMRKYSNQDIERIFGIKDLDTDGYVDHQSVLSFPRNLDGSLCEEFIKDFIKFVMRDDVMILGGNDNGGDHYLSRPDWDEVFSGVEEGNVFNGSGVRRGGILDEYSTVHAVQYDGYWVLFNPSTGKKVRLSFDSIKPIVHKSITPELVDLKITDYCDYGCTYCYQNSSKSGKHAALPDIKNIIDQLSDAHCFEIAIGGGEPTKHPNFIEMLVYAKDKNITPSFSTRNYKWINDYLGNNSCTNTFGAIGYSVQSVADLQKITVEQWLHYKITPHIVLGTLPMDELIRLLQFCVVQKYVPLLLGYKSVGRGTVPQYPYDSDTVHDALTKAQIPAIGLDTSAVKQLRPGMWPEVYKPELYMTDGEGAFSCYIDATTNMMARSSYDDQKVPFDSHWLEMWSTYVSDCEFSAVDF